MPLNITMASGRTVDVATKEGANYFIQDPSGPFEFFSTNLEHVQQVCDRVYRRSNRRATPQEENEIGILYTMATGLGENADYDVFEKIPESEIRLYLEHVMGEMDRMAEPNTNWTRTGKLIHYHEEMLVGCLIGLFMQRIPVKVALEIDFFSTFAKFASAGKVAADPADTITMIVSNVAVSTLVYGDRLPSVAKIFAKLEASGILEQFIRLSVVNPVCERGVLKSYELLNGCTSLIQKKFTEDQPCGKACKELLSKSSLQRHPVMSKLRQIMSFTNWTKKREDMPREIKDGYKQCKKCNKMEQTLEFQGSLQKCSRCRAAWYCSKECQRADWKDHKPFCKPVSKKESKIHRFSEQSVLDFIQNNYVSILREIVNVSKETGLKKRELLLELDFYDSCKNGKGAPALQDPPKFKIAATKGYLEGSRPNEPDWFYKHEDKKCYESNVGLIVKGLQDAYDRLTDKHLLVYARPPSGENCGFYRMQLQAPNTFKQMFSQQTIDAAIKAIDDDDFGPLSSIFGEGSQIDNLLRREFGGPPSDTELDRVRMLLNNLGANFELTP